MFKVQDEATESALCVGIISALVWGIGLSVYGLQQQPGALSWAAWFAQLLGGIVTCVVAPLLFIRGREWVLARMHAPGREPLRQQG